LLGADLVLFNAVPTDGASVRPLPVVFLRSEAIRAMKPFKNFTGLVAPMDRSNVDTDQ